MRASTVRSALAVLVAVWAAGCGGGGGGATAPSAPQAAATPTPPPAPPEFLDGWSGAPAVASVEPAAPTMGARTVVSGAGYLTREAVFDGSPYFLWPSTDESYVRTFVYNEFVPGRRLTRWEQGFAVTASPELLSDERIRPIIDAAAAEASRASGLPISVQSSGEVSVVVDPTDARFASGDAVALTRLTFRGNVIVGARLIFLDQKYLLATGNRVRTNTMLHEMGHTLGLGHSPDGHDVMHVEGQRTDAREFSERENVTLRMMYARRKPGNTAPDRDPALSASSSQAGEVTIACGR